jgi:hypothetical protein
MQGKGTEKKSCKGGVEKKHSCRVNGTVGLTNCIRLKGTLAATLYYSFLGPGGIPIHLIFSTNRKTDIFPFPE